ncbi:MAG: ABC transporter permease [Clostridiales bacterium]|nr:ABC transporter permease [Clostridiales bacterium]
MRLSELLKSALSSIWSRKVRSFLTSLGVIIGVFAVSALLSVGQASINKMNENMSDLNADIIEVNIFNNEKKIKLSEIDKIAEMDAVKNAAPSIETNTEITKGENKASAKMIATTKDLYAVKDYKLNRGRFIGDIDVNSQLKSVVLGLTTCLEMFGTTDVIGEEVYISGTKYTIIGVLDEMKSSFMSNPNKQIYIPITTGQVYYSLGNISAISIMPKDGMNEKANEAIKNFLSKKYSSKNDYYVSSDENIQDFIQESNKTMMALLGGIGGISLLVSGIGIMNIMLVSVRERTKEIGIRKAVGAKRRDILTQFLIEAMSLSLFGGMMGLLVTILTSELLGSAIDLTIVLEPWIVLLSTLFSLVVGVVFGLYPAVKASALRPVEALHYE